MQSAICSSSLVASTAPSSSAPESSACFMNIAPVIATMPTASGVCSISNFGTASAWSKKPTNQHQSQNEPLCVPHISRPSRDAGTFDPEQLISFPPSSLDKLPSTAPAPRPTNNVPFPAAHSTLILPLASHRAEPAAHSQPAPVHHPEPRATPCVRSPPDSAFPLALC